MAEDRGQGLYGAAHFAQDVQQIVTEFKEALGALAERLDAREYSAWQQSPAGQVVARLDQLTDQAIARLEDPSYGGASLFGPFQLPLEVTRPMDAIRGWARESDGVIVRDTREVVPLAAQIAQQAALLRAQGKDFTVRMTEKEQGLGR